jgi:hypothetical protein
MRWTSSGPKTVRSSTYERRRCHVLNRAFPAPRFEVVNLKVSPAFLHNDDRIEALVSVVGIALLASDASKPNCAAAPRRRPYLSGLLPEGRTPRTHRPQRPRRLRRPRRQPTTAGLQLDPLTGTQRLILALLDIPSHGRASTLRNARSAPNSGAVRRRCPTRLRQCVEGASTEGEQPASEPRTGRTGRPRLPSRCRWQEPVRSRGRRRCRLRSITIGVGPAAAPRSPRGPTARRRSPPGPSTRPWREQARSGPDRR